MRIATVSLAALLLAGCLSTQSSVNPMKRKGKKKAEAAPVASEAVAEPKPAPKLPELNLDKVGLMKEMFLVQRDLNKQILKMAEALSEVELMEFNLWLKQYGVQLKAKRCTDPTHDHSKPGHKSRVY